MADMVLGITTWTGGTYETGDKIRRDTGGRAGRTKGGAGRERQEWWVEEGELGTAKVSWEGKARLEAGAK